MGVDTKIYLNPHAKPTQIFDVILKVVGHEFRPTISSLHKKIKPDLNQPPSKDNRWYLKPVKDEENKIEPSDIRYFNIDFQDAVGSNYHCMIHLDIEDEYFNYGKLINPGSTPIWHAIGKRLVDFFGGKMLYSDADNYDDPDNWYVNETAKFSARVSGQDEDDRWYQYYAALFNEPILHSTEILEDKVMYQYLHDREKQLVDYLEYLERVKLVEKEVNELKESLEKNPEPNKKTIKKL
jgi:hypothetical protein